MSFSLGPSGLTGGGKNDILGDFTTIYDSGYGGFNLSTTATEVFAHSDNGAVSLSTGTYVIRIYVDRAGNGGWYGGYFTGIMQWYGSETNSTNSSDIPLHGSAHAFNNGYLYARTQMQSSGGGGLRLLVWSNSSGADSSVTLQIAVKRLT